MSCILRRALGKDDLDLGDSGSGLEGALASSSAPHQVPRSCTWGFCSMKKRALELLVEGRGVGAKCTEGKQSTQEAASPGPWAVTDGVV